MTRRIQSVAAVALVTTGLAALALVVAMAGSATAGSPAVPARSAPAKIKLRSTGRGKLLTAGNGFTVYAFSRDAKKKDACAKISGCMQAWPPITTHGKPQAGHGVKRSLLGTIKVGGKSQVTYAGHPLYGYVGDSAPGQTDYVGVPAFGGTWPALTAGGKLVH